LLITPKGLLFLVIGATLRDIGQRCQTLGCVAPEEPELETNRIAKNVVLTYNCLRSLKPAAPGKRDLVNDVLVPGLKVMVTDRGSLSYGMKRRWPGWIPPKPGQQQQPTWHRIGDVYVPPKQKTEGDIETDKLDHSAGVLTIKEARDVARSWLDQLARGIDPREAERLRKAEAAEAAKRERALRFSTVAEQFKAQHLSKLRKSGEMSRIVDNHYVDAWGDRPLKSITKTDVRAVIRPIVGTPYQALNVFRTGSLLFNWAAEELDFDGGNPFSGLKPSGLIGDTPARTRTLNDDEIRAVWQAAGTMWQHGVIVKLLLLTGCRSEEIVELQSSEIKEHEIIIQGPRRKRIRGKAAPDLLVPLRKTMRDLLAAQHCQNGPYVFTTTNGHKPLAGFSDRKKKELDRRSSVSDWIIHDLRRTARTHLPACGIPENISETMIGHTKRGIVATYELYDFEAQKRDGFAKWEARLLGIVNKPPSSTVADFAARARRAS
jgi:integrase